MIGRQLLDMRWTLSAAVVIGLALSPAANLPYLIYDALVPVVRMQGELVSKTEDSVVVHIWGSKSRECKYLGLQAFSTGPNGNRRDANITRLDMPSAGATKPKGEFDIGNWKLWPVTGAVSVQVYVQHDCDGRILNAQIAEVVL